jgi:uncharacterized protein (TIGR02147 family)
MVIMVIFTFSDYRSYLIDYIPRLPKKGRGEVAKIAVHLGVHPTLVSMVLSGSRDFTYEQALDLSTYLKHDEIEERYFLLLVQYARAGNQRLKLHFKKEIDLVRAKAARVSKNMEYDTQIAEADRVVFYSSWIYSAVRLYCSISDEGKTAKEVSERFQLSAQRAEEVLDFLMSVGLVDEEKGRFKIDINLTFLEFGSIHLPRHHMNWRLKAMQKSDHVSDSELMLTCPMSISKDDFSVVRREINSALKKISKIIKDSPAEEVACLNIDLFWVEK